MQFQFSNNDKLLSRGDKNSEDKENQFQVCINLCMTYNKHMY